MLKNCSTNSLDPSWWLTHCWFLHLRCDGHAGKSLHCCQWWLWMLKQSRTGLVLLVYCCIYILKCYLVVCILFYFNKLRRIAVKLLDISPQGNSSLFLIQLGDLELKPFPLAAAFGKARGWGAWGCLCWPQVWSQALPFSFPYWHCSQCRVDRCPRGEAWCHGWREARKDVEDVTGVACKLNGLCCSTMHVVAHPPPPSNKPHTAWQAASGWVTSLEGAFPWEGRGHRVRLGSKACGEVTLFLSLWRFSVPDSTYQGSIGS